MFERELTLYAFNLELARRLTAELDETNLYQSLPGGGNPPAWILGHLAISTDYALQTLGQKKQCPDDWHKQFGPGSQPGGLTIRPSKTELVRAFENGHALVSAAAKSPDPARLSRPHPVEFIRDTPIQTNEHLLAHLLTTHESMHLGQLSMWRRQQGHKPLF